jgi:hypothetical protein
MSEGNGIVMSMEEINFGKLSRQEIQEYTGKVLTDEQWRVFTLELNSLVSEFIDDELQPLSDDIERLVEENNWWEDLQA